MSDHPVTVSVTTTTGTLHQPPVRSLGERTRAGIDAAVLAIATIAATAPLAGVYDIGRFWVVAITGAVCGAGVATMVRLLGWRPWTAWPFAAGGYLLVGVPLAVPGEAVYGVLPSPDGLGMLLAAPVAGWRQILTIPVPVGDYEALLAPVLALAIACAAAAVQLRRRSPLLAAAVPLLALIGSLLLGTRAGAAVPWWGALLTVVLLPWLAASPGRFGLGRFGLRRVVSAVALVLVCATIGAAAGLLAPSPVVARDAITPPFDARAFPSPLATFRSWFTGERPQTVLFTVEGAPAGSRLRLAVLDEYDGTVYEIAHDALFQRVPDQLTPDPAMTGGEATVRIRSTGYAGPWLPVVGSATAIEPSARLVGTVLVNPATGAAAAARGVQPGDAWTATGSLPLTGITIAPPAATDSIGGPAVPGPVDEALGAVAGAAAGDDLGAVLRALHDDAYLSHGQVRSGEQQSRSGHSFDRILSLLDDEPRVGDQEQYSVAAALLSQRLGYPARVVVGFDIPEDGTVRGENADAWLEVQTERGWQSVDVTPDETALPDDTVTMPDPQQRVEQAVPPVDPTVPEDDDPAAQEAGELDEPARDTGLEALLAIVRVAGIAALVLLIAALPFTLIAVLKTVRRARRRRRGGARDRIRGAWLEVEDLALDLRLTMPENPTRRQVAATYGGATVRSLARIADKAAFAPEEPTADEVEASWDAVDALHADRREGLSRWQQMRLAFTPRSLLPAALLERARGRDARRTAAA